MKVRTERNGNQKRTGDEEKEEEKKKECDRRRENGKVCCDVADLFRLINDSCMDELVRLMLNSHRPAPKLIIRVTDLHCGLHTNSVFSHE
jgi:hypothetical protein